MNDLGTYYALYLPGHGYVQFNSYRQVTITDVSAARALFKQRGPAETYRENAFWVGRERHEGSELEIHKIRLQWEREVDDGDQTVP